MNIHISPEIIETFGEEVVQARLNSVVEEFENRLKDQKVRAYGEAVYASDVLKTQVETEIAQAVEALEE